jgi:MAP7 domain-containing protein 1
LFCFFRREKEESERRSKEEAEKKRLELEEKLRREEEERLARKKRIEEIMARSDQKLYFNYTNKIAS